MSQTFKQFLQLLFEDEVSQAKKRIEFVTKTLEPKWENLASVVGYKKLDDFVERLAAADPSRNKQFIQWLATRIAKSPHDNRAEDLVRTGQDLKLFDENKAKLEVKDINQYKTFSDLYAAIEPFTKKQAPTEKEKQEAKLDKIKEGIKTVYSGPEGWLKIPTTKKAAQLIGMGTRWCTSAKCNNMFDHYAGRDKLIVVYDKASGKRSQLHILDGQYMDEADVSIPHEKFPEWARAPLSEWYRKNEKALGLKHVLFFSKLGVKDAAKNTEHEDLIELMKHHGVI